MLQPWTIAASVVGSLLAVLAGSCLTMYAQKREWARQQSVRWDVARSEVYGKFLGTCNAYFIALCDVARPMRHAMNVEKVRSKFAVSEKYRIDVTFLKGEVDMLAHSQTKVTANRLFDHLKTMNTDLDTAHEKYANDKDRGYPTEVKEYRVYEQEYFDEQGPFLSAINSELHIG